MSVNTRRTYQQSLAVFLDFRKSLSITDSWPIPLDHITQFIAYLSLNRFSPSSVKCYVSGLNFYHKLKNFYDLTQVFVVRKLLDGIKRSKSPVPDARLPITYDILKKLIANLPIICNSKYEGILFSTAFILSFFAFLRVGEVTVPNKDTIAGHTIKVENICCNDEIIQLHLHSSKNDQFGKGIILTITKQVDTDFCPVRHLNKYLALRPKIGGPLFCHYGGKPLTRYQFTAMLKKILSVLNLSTLGQFGTHSFRIGGATHFAMLGYSNEEVQQMGRWKSDAYKTYIRIPQF